MGIVCCTASGLQDQALVCRAWRKLIHDCKGGVAMLANVESTRVIGRCNRSRL
jgi:CTP synthase (UTP-ammonia lyase)